MLEGLNWVHQYTPFVVSEGLPLSTIALIIWLMSAFYFLAKNKHFLAKIVPLIKAIASELC